MGQDTLFLLTWITRHAQLVFCYQCLWMRWILCNLALCVCRHNNIVSTFSAILEIFSWKKCWWQRCGPVYLVSYHTEYFILTNNVMYMIWSYEIKCWYYRSCFTFFSRTLPVWYNITICIAICIFISMKTSDYKYFRADSKGKAICRFMFIASILEVNLKS